MFIINKAGRGIYWYVFQLTDVILRRRGNIESKRISLVSDLIGLNGGILDQLSAFENRITNIDGNGRLEMKQALIAHGAGEST